LTFGMQIVVICLSVTCRYCWCAEHSTEVSVWSLCWTVVRICIHSTTRS